MFLRGDRRRYSKIFHLILIIIIAVAGFYYARLFHNPSPFNLDIEGKTLEIKGSPKSEAVPLSFHQDMFSQIVSIDSALDNEDRYLNIQEMRIISNSILMHDRTYLIRARVPGDIFSNPGNIRNIISGYALEVHDTGSADTGIFGKARSRLNDFMKNNFSSETAPFLMSIITGERSLITREMNNAFNVTGLAHILSISGAHFGLLFFILFKIFNFLIKMLPYRILVRLTLYFTPSQIAAAACIPSMIGYLCISSMSLPAIRSFIMITLFLIGLFIGRKGFWLNTLLFAAAVILIIQPDSILDISCQLSFIAVLCIGLVAEQQRHSNSEEQQAGPLSAKKFFSSAIQYFKISMLISLAATIGTAPLVAYYFHYFSVISPLTNLIITPVIGFVILPLSLISSFIFLISNIFPLQSLIDSFTAFVMDLIRHIAQWNFVDIKIPAFPSVLLFIFYLGILIYTVMNVKNSSEAAIQKKPSRIVFKILMPLSIALIPLIIYTGIKLFEHQGLRITHLDAGQGDTAVIELPDSRVLVLDTGRNGLQTGNFLRYRGIKKVDVIILSHGHPDHVGGLEYLLDNFSVAGIWDNNRLKYIDGLPEGISHRGLQRGDIVEGAGYKITVLHPYDGFYTMYSHGDDANNDSLVFKLQCRNAFLFAGDIGAEAEEDLTHLKEYLKSAVLKVPHHGSRTAASEEFFNAVLPQIAMISAGRKNIYGHPHEEMLEMLQNARILRTDMDGAIGLQEMSDGTIKIKTWKEFQLTEAKTMAEEFMNLKKLFWVW
jgi:competence protein ComEC